MSGDVLSEYVDVRRLSATKDMSFFSRLLENTRSPRPFVLGAQHCDG